VPLLQAEGDLQLAACYNAYVSFRNDICHRGILLRVLPLIICSATNEAMRESLNH